MQCWGYASSLTLNSLLFYFTGDMLGVPSPPPFADPSTVGRRILDGVNFASANGGILLESGRHYVLYTLVLIIVHLLLLLSSSEQ